MIRRGAAQRGPHPLLSANDWQRAEKPACQRPDRYWLRRNRRLDLPEFVYHPDPIATGSVKPSDTECVCCGSRRGFIYVGPVYAEEELEDCICPWCIANGTAYEKLGAEFVDAAGIGGYGDWDDVPGEVADEIAYRTPGFAGWQQERWWTHCGDAAEFIGRAGRKEVESYGEQLVKAVQYEIGYSDEEWKHYFQALSKESSPTAYIFRCRHCGKLGGYSDSD